MAVITISRELGSDGHEIAQQVAHQLGYLFVDQHTIDGIFRQYGLTRFDDLYNAAPSFLDLINADNLLLVSMANEIIEALAKRGNVVIQSRAGFAVLGDYEDVLHVHVQAPFAERVQRVLVREGLDDLQAAEERVREDDEMHHKYVGRFYNQQWEAPSNFDLMIDTVSVPGDLAVQQIVEAAQAFAHKALGAGAVTTTSIQVEPVLADAVAKALA